MEKLIQLHRRLEKLNIQFICWTNYPWVYISKINKHIITEKLDSEHGFVIGYLNTNTLEFEFYNTTELFKLIRKYGSMGI